METTQCTIIKSGRCDQYGRPLAVSQSYTGPVDYVRALVSHGFASVSDAQVFDDDSTPAGSVVATIPVGSSAVSAVVNPLTGGIDIQSGGETLPVVQSVGSPNGGMSLSDGNVSFESRLLKPRQHNVIREFTTLTGVTNAATGGTVTPTIDLVSPFGGRAMKLAFGAGVTQHDLTISGFTLPDFKAGRGKLAILCYFEDARAISQVQAFAGTDSGFATNLRCDHRMANDAVHHAHGVQQIVISPELATSDNTVATDDVAAVRLRFHRSGTPIANGVHNLPGDVAASAYATNVWVKGVYLPESTKPFVVLTFDDASRSWMTLLRPALNARGIKGTFGVNKTDVGTNPALFVDEADLNTLHDDGHDIASHNLTNTAFTIAGYANYLSDFRTCRDWHRNAGRTGRLDYHPYVQGAYNPELSASMEAEGVKWCRCVNNRNFERPLFDYGFHGQLPSRSLGSGSSLSVAQGWVTSAIARQQDVVVMGHEFAATAANSVTWAISDLEAFLDSCLALKASGQIAGIGSLSEYIEYAGFGGTL